MTLTPGTRLGPYEVLTLIGSGGMGEVYAVIDPRLGRQIALKVLRAEFAADPDRAARFEREARAVAALNHPNIVTIHSIETWDGLQVLAMELVDGRRLADLIPMQGLSLDRFLQIAIPLVDAVSAAHGKGITHRDLKPANVMVTPESRVKVLDFGLAKLRDNGSGPLAGEPTRDVTTAGHIVGTCAYMSPEQAEGRAIDHRSDVFSLGIMLYEMATGQRPFTGDTDVATLAAIVRDTPRPIGEIRSDLPHDLLKIVRKALAKDPERRYQAAKELRNDLETLKEDSASGELVVAASAVPADRQAARWIAAAAVIAVAALAGAIWMRPRPVDPLRAGTVGATFTQLTFQAGMERFPSLSPDGKWVVYSAAAGEGNEDIYLQSVGGQNAINLTKDSPADDTQPAFSPDGEHIAFRSERNGGGLFVMGRTGEGVRRLTRTGFTPAWSPDGKQIAYSTADSPLTPYSGGGLGEIWIVDIASGATRQIPIAGEMQGGRQPAWSPDGIRIAFRASRRGVGGGIWSVRAGGGVATRVTADAGTEWLPAWSPDGTFIYYSGDRDGRLNLWRVPVGAHTGVATAAPERVPAPSGQATYLSIAADGKHVAYSSLTLDSNIQRVALEPGTLRAQSGAQWLTQGTRYWATVRASPDGTAVVLGTGLARSNELFVAGADGSGLRQLSDGFSPEWLPDGRILFGKPPDVGGTLFPLWSIATDGSNLTLRLNSRETGPTLISPDGGRVILHRHEGIVTKLVLFDLRTGAAPGSGEEVGSVTIDGSFEPTSWSPDGRMVAGSVNAQPGGIVVYTLSSHEATRITRTGERPRWLDAATLLYDDRGAVRLIEIATRNIREIFSATPHYVRAFDISPDRQWLYVARGAQEADIWLATLK